MAVQRLAGGNTPANGGDPRTFPAIWNATADVIDEAVLSEDVRTVVVLTQAEYDAISVPDPETLYVIVG
jgi:hypothetical protein